MKIEISGSRVHVENGESITICFSQWVGDPVDGGFAFGEIKIEQGTQETDPVTVEILGRERLVQVIRKDPAKQAETEPKSGKSCQTIRRKR